MEFLQNRRSSENQKPPENCQKSGLFWASAFTMHLVCTLLIIGIFCILGVFFRYCLPRGPGEASWCHEAKIAARQFLPLNCRAITLTTGAILKEEKMSSIVGERQFGRHFKRQFGWGQLRVKNCRETVGSQFCREASRCLAGRSGLGFRNLGPEVFFFGIFRGNSGSGHLEAL